MALDKSMRGIGMGGTTKGPMPAGGFDGDIAAREGEIAPPPAKAGKKGMPSASGDKAARPGVKKGAKSKSSPKKADGPTPGAVKSHSVKKAGPTNGTWPKLGGMSSGGLK